MPRIFVVHGQTGEYDDHRTWQVAAFTSKRRAQTWARRANAWAKRHGLHNEHVAYNNRDKAADNPYDPGARCDYTGMSYYVVPARLNPALPTAAEERA